MSQQVPDPAEVERLTEARRAAQHQAANNSARAASWAAWILLIPAAVFVGFMLLLVVLFLVL